MHRVKAVLYALLTFRLVVFLAPFLLLTGRSWRGYSEGLFGVAFSSLLITGLVALGYWGSGVWPAPDPILVALGVSVALFAACCVIASGFARTCHFGEGPVGSHFLRAEPDRHSLGWADVEDEYLWLLTQLVTRLDPWMPAAEAVAARDRVRDLVDEVRTHPDYHCLGRVGDVRGYTLLRGVLDPHHCYSYRPEPRDPGERFGLLVFLHGHGGNFLVLLHALRPLADEHRLVLVYPSFGYGNWEAPGGVEAVERARRFGMAAFPVDPGRVFLAGISQGGAGVGRAAAADPEGYAGLVFISPAMEPKVLGSAAFADGWRGRPVLVIQGERDHHVRPRTVTAAVDLMQANGADVTYHLDPDGGHFLFFAKLDEVRELIGAWLSRVG